MTNGDLNRKLRMALVGGGQGAFIGRVHATAAVLDNRAALVAGALSSDPQKAKASAPDYDIPAGSRLRLVSRSWSQKEKALPADQRIDFVSVATPNHTHFEIAKAAVEAGFNVMCDKPMTFDLAQAEKLAGAVDKSGVVFAVTHNYTGYPLVRQAREMILAGELGEINAIRSFYIQGWLRTRPGAGEPEAGLLADRSDQERRGRLLWRHRHARLQPGPLHDRPVARRDQLPSEDVRPGPQARRLRHGGDPLRERRAGHGHRLADQPRPRERPVHRDRRHEGLAAMAAGGAQPDDPPPQRPAARHLHPRSQRAVHQPSGARPPAACPAAIPRRSSKPSPTSTASPTTTWRCGPPARSSSGPTRSIPTSTTASRGCTSSSSPSPAASKGAPGCRSSTRGPGSKAALPPLSFAAGLPAATLDVPAGKLNGEPELVQ